VQWYFRELRRIDLVTRKLSRGRIPRWIGDHHAMSLLSNAKSVGIGKIPERYAAISVEG